MNNGQQKQIYNKERSAMGTEINQNQMKPVQRYFLCNQCCFWIFQVIVIILALTAMSKVIVGYQTTQEVIASNHYEHSKQTVWLWNQGYIIDIKVEKTNNCPEGYQPLLSYQWPGSVDGCYCTSTNNGYFIDFVLKGKCTSELISLGCQKVNALAAQNLNMWKSNSLLCYKRASSMTFYESVMTQAPSGGTSATMSTCAVNTTYQVSTLPGVPCPVSAFSNSSVGTSQTTLTLDSTTNTVLNFINQTSYPIAALKLTQYQFCQFFNTSNISPSKKGTYILENNPLSQPCLTTDPRMVEIDSIDELNLYQNNTRIYQYIQALPAYPQPSIDYTYKLGYIPYPTWTYSCRNSDKYKLTTTTSKILFEGSKDALRITVGIVVTCALILVILMRLIFIIRHIVDLRSRTSYNALMMADQQIAEQIPTLDIIKSFKRQCCLFVVELFLVLGIAGSIVYSLHVLTNQSRWIKEIIKQQCTDQHLEKIFLYYQQKIDYIAVLLVEASFVWGVLLISHFCYFVMRNYIGDLASKVVQQQSEKEVSIDPNQIMVLDKQDKLDGYNLNQDSAEVILPKQDNSELKIYDMQFLMGDNGGETKENFFGGLDREANVSITKKKKKKRTLNKKKKPSKIIPDDFDEQFS